MDGWMDGPMIMGRRGSLTSVVTMAPRGELMEGWTDGRWQINVVVTVTFTVTVTVVVIVTVVAMAHRVGHICTLMMRNEGATAPLRVQTCSIGKCTVY